MYSHKTFNNRIYIFITSEEADKFALLFKGLISANGKFVTI